MPKKISDKEMLDQIREVITDWSTGTLEVVAHCGIDVEKGEIHTLDGDLAATIIEDILNRKASELKRDYRKTKAHNLKAASPGLK
jgi:hypothetical protein